MTEKLSVFKDLGNVMSIVGTGLSAFGTSMIDPAKGTALTTDMINADREIKLKNKQLDNQRLKITSEAEKNFQKYLREQNDPVKQLKNYEAQNKFNAYLKQQQGVPLSPFDKQLLGVKDPNDKPSDLELYKQAGDDALKLLGGSAMVGLSEKKSAQYESIKKQKFLDLKKQFGTETPQDKADRASMYLKNAGYASSPDVVESFLKQNPKF